MPLLSEQALHDLAVHVCQTIPASLEFISQLLVIDAQQVQQRRLQIVH